MSLKKQYGRLANRFIDPIEPKDFHNAQNS